MMKNKVFRVALLVTVLLGFFSACANQDTPQNTVTVFESMDKWMKKNRPDVKFIDSGIYYNLYPNHIAGDTLKPSDTSCVEITVTGRLLDGTYFLNSDPRIARVLGTFSYRTHYVPFKYEYKKYSSYPFTNVGINALLTKMNRGDSAIVFFAPDYTFANSEDEVTQYEGFGGSQKYINPSVSYYSIKLNKIILDPDSIARQQVIDYATNELKLKGRDSIKRGIYIKRTDSLGGGVFLGKKDTTITIRYVGRFIDGFVFDTNIKSVALENNIYSPLNAYEPLSYKMNISDSETGNLITAFKYVVQKMKVGDKATFITEPSWAYGADGDYKTTGTLIQTYTPLIFDIEILQK